MSPIDPVAATDSPSLEPARPRRRWPWIVLALAFGVAIFAWQLATAEPEWTTSVDEARRQLVEGLEDLERRYYSEALEHFERAVEADPEFVAPKLMMLYFHDVGSERGDELVEQLRAAPTELLNERERFLLTYRLARIDGDRSEANRVLDAFLERSPEDAWGIMTRCDQAWEAEDVAAAETCLGRLVELYPNWSMALSRLGIVSMARAQFDEAERLFETARYIAPEQAAPYDSLGQLYSVLGRYEEAEQAFVRSIEAKADFCIARRHLVQLYYSSGRLAEARTALDRTAEAPGCEAMHAKGYFCALRAWLTYLEGDVEGAAEQVSGECTSGPGTANVLLALRLALVADRGDEVERLALRLVEAAERFGDQDEYALYTNFIESQRRHADGLRAARAGEWQRACKAFESADEISLYWGMERGLFKLRNRRELAHCLEQTRHGVGAEVILRQIGAVNPRYLAESPVEPMGPDRESPAVSEGGPSGS